MIIIWVASFALMAVFAVLRLVFMPFHFWGDHFANLERSYRYQVFIRGFQLCFLKLIFCSLLNLKSVPITIFTCYSKHGAATRSNWHPLCALTCC